MTSQDRRGRQKMQDGGIKERASYRKDSKARKEGKVGITEIRGCKQAPKSQMPQVMPRDWQGWVSTNEERML